MKRLTLRLVGLLTSLFCLVPQAQTSSDFTHGVDVAGSTATIWFKASSSTTTWVDVHYRHNGGALQNLRMGWNAGSQRHEQNVLTAVATGHTVA